MAYTPITLTKPISIQSLRTLKTRSEKFVAIALYDAHMAAVAQRCGVEIVLVGDSLGMTVLGFDSTIPVTMEHMIHHVEAVQRGNKKSLIIGDLPFMAYSTPEQAMLNASRIMQAGAHMVKMEGGSWLCDTVNKLSQRGIPICGHLGLTPQSVNKLGGYLVQGREESSAKQLLEDAHKLEKAGCDLLVLECIPQSLADTITKALSIPTIGIGAGPNTDAQVLVINDILGLTERAPKFSKNFLLETGNIPDAIQKFVINVKEGLFPDQTHSF